MTNISKAEQIQEMHKINVLLVDDEKDFVTTLSERIQMRNFDSTFALSGSAALNLIAEKAFDVIILDLKMPGLGGMEVLRRLKKTYPEIQVIILTGHGSENDEDEARRLGAFDYLKKPIDIEALVKQIKDAFNNKITD